MALPFYNWSKTAASNATADSTVNWAEGQAPSSVNDSARAMMASLAAFRDDISGATVTGGTSTAYTLATYEVFPSGAIMSGKPLAFTPHATSGASPTLNVDGLGAVPLRASPGVDLPAGVLIQGTPYVATYNVSDVSFYLHSFYGNPYNLPLGGVLPLIVPAVPNSSFAFPFGQGLSTTTYAALFALIGTTYGGGGGTFNLPDLRGRGIYGKDDMGGTPASRLTATYFGANASTLGAVGGSESRTLLTANLPAYTPGGSVAAGTAAAAGGKNIVTDSGGISSSSATGGVRGQFTDVSAVAEVATLAVTSGAFTGIAQGGTSTAFAIASPGMALNFAVRII